MTSLAKKNVLIIGSGGTNKYDYLEWLGKMGATVILLEPEKSNYAYPAPHETYYAPFGNLGAVIEQAKKIVSHHSITVIDTVYEFAMEPAAFVREAVGFSGLTPDLVKYGRRKTAMAKFMSSHGIRTAPYIVFDKDVDCRLVKEQMEKHGNIEWILRPDDLASNIGIRKLRGINDFQTAFDSAQYDIPNHPYKASVYNESNMWILNHYIHGHEVEAEICIHKGEVVFLCTLLKTIIFERDNVIEENRCVTPVAWLDKENLKDMYLQIQNLVDAVYRKVMKPSQRDTLIVYVEFRIDKSNKAYVLEFTFRNGGYLNPMVIEMSTGINPYYLSALATLNIDVKLKKEPLRCASGYQSIYSNREGIFEKVKGIKNIPGIILKEEVSSGYKISVPHSEILMNVIAAGSTAEKVDELLDEALQDAFIVVDGAPVSIPLSPFVNNKRGGIKIRSSHDHS